MRVDEPPPPAVRGWHGMTPCRHMAGAQAAVYWTIWAAADPTTGNARMVHVAPRSPAQDAGMESGDWVVSIDGMSIDLWERRGGAVGACIHVVAYRHPVGRYAADVILIAAPARVPKPHKPRRAAAAKPNSVEPGRRVGPGERLQWQAAMIADHAVTPTARGVAVYLATVRADARNVAYPGRARIARDLDRSVRTIERATALLRRRGWILVASGRRDGATNRYFLTWPAGQHNRCTTSRERHI